MRARYRPASSMTTEHEPPRLMFSVTPGSSYGGRVGERLVPARALCEEASVGHHDPGHAHAQHTSQPPAPAVERNEAAGVERTVDHLDGDGRLVGHSRTCPTEELDAGVVLVAPEER